MASGEDPDRFSLRLLKNLVTPQQDGISYHDADDVTDHISGEKDTPTENKDQSHSRVRGNSRRNDKRYGQIRTRRGDIIAQDITENWDNNDSYDDENKLIQISDNDAERSINDKSPVFSSSERAYHGTNLEEMPETHEQGDFVCSGHDDTSELSSSASSQAARGSQKRKGRRYKPAIVPEGLDILERKYRELQRLTDETYMSRQEEIKKQHAHQTKLLYDKYRQLMASESNKRATNPPENSLKRESSNLNTSYTVRIPEQDKNTMSQQQSPQRRPRSAFIHEGDRQRLTASLTVESRSRSVEKSNVRRMRSLSANSSPRLAGDPTDHQLKNTRNEKILGWLKEKNALMRMKAKSERMRRRNEYQERIMAANEKLERRLESQKIVKDWMDQKRKEKLRQQRDTKSRNCTLPNTECGSKMFMMLTSYQKYQKTDVCCDSSETSQHIPKSKRGAQVRMIMESYREKRNEPLPTSGLQASEKALTSRPTSAKKITDENMNKELGRKSYNQWLSDKRKSDIVKNHDRKQEAIKKILSASDNESSIGGAGNGDIVVRGNGLEIRDEKSNLLVSSLTRDDMIKTTLLASKRTKKKLPNKNTQQKKDKRQVNVISYNVPFPPDEGCPAHVARIQEKLCLNQVGKIAPVRPEPQGSDDQPLRCQKFKTTNVNSVASDNNLSLKLQTYNEENINSTVSESLKMPINNHVHANKGKSESTQSSILSSYDLARQTNIVHQIENSIFTEDSEVNKLTKIDNLDPQDFNREYSDKHVVFSAAAPEINEYEPIDIESDPDQIINVVPDELCHGLLNASDASEDNQGSSFSINSWDSQQHLNDSCLDIAQGTEEKGDWVSSTSQKLPSQHFA